jgi:hypothetical protein
MTTRGGASILVPMTSPSTIAPEADVAVSLFLQGFT